MPIYGYGLINAPWGVATEIKTKDAIALKAILEKELEALKYSNSQFADTVHITPANVKTMTMAKYDSTGSKMVEWDYIKTMEKFIKAANDKIVDGKKFADRYKFDITGSWVCGQIIIMANSGNKNIKTANTNSAKDVVLFADKKTPLSKKEILKK